jgi:1,2-beta-oligoglucan phosphorylase
MAALNDPSWRTPHEDDLRLRRIGNGAGMNVSMLANGCVFAIEHRADAETTLINQVLASPIEGGLGLILIRVGGAAPYNVDAVGNGARGRFGLDAERAVWEGSTHGLRHRVSLQLLDDRTAWLWCVDVTNAGASGVDAEAVLVQDLGLGARGFVSNNEAYASQYIDHHIVRDERLGPVVMSRQNLAQSGKHPWVMHGCLDGASSFATDAMQLFGPGHRDAQGIASTFGTPIGDRRLQHEVSCAAIQSLSLSLAPGRSARWRFFALYDANHAAASSDDDLARLQEVAWPGGETPLIATREMRRSLLQDASPADAKSLDRAALAARYPQRILEEWKDGEPLSFFVPDGAHNRHVVLRDKERIVTRRHGALLRSGGAFLPDEATLCATCWMHGVFAAQLTIGNTSFHKLFSVSRDPYNIMRASGLRVLVDMGQRWRLLTVPSAFEMGLSDCRWVYVFADRTVTVHAIAAGDDAAMQWRIAVDGAACRFLVAGHLVLGEREFEHAGRVTVDAAACRFRFGPDPDSLWGQQYPDAAYWLVTSTPEGVDAIGGDELLYAGHGARNGSHVAIRTAPTREFCFAVVGSLDDAAVAARLAEKYAQPRNDDELLAPAMAFWSHVTRGVRLVGDGRDAAALDASLPWFAHDAMIHLTVPHGLEQYTGAAWGTRDVCQGPVELLLTLEHDEPVKQILRIVFAQQYATRGDWPQWFMLEPYSAIHDKHSHGDVIIWPLKALNDYLEATGDLAFLDENAPWRDDETLERTVHVDSIVAHVERLIATVRERFIAGTHLVRYGEGDWNDSLQPADPALRDSMVSSWTVALLYHQLMRYAAVLRHAGRAEAAQPIHELAQGMQGDFHRLLVRDGVLAGYALFQAGIESAELLLHPSDPRTGLRYSLLPMTRSILAQLFTPEQAKAHVEIIREHLLFADGARLIDRPVEYHGGLERIFRRAESASFFGREIGLMYVHAHLWYGEAMAALGEVDALWDALLVANPVSVNERVANAAPRQRNAYFSSSDAAFADRYAASAQWSRVRDGAIAVEGGWRIYSSGPGLYVNLLLRHALGMQRIFGARVSRPALPASLIRLERRAE